MLGLPIEWEVLNLNKSGPLWRPCNIELELRTVDSKKLEHRCRIISVGVAFFSGIGLEDGHVPIFWPLLQLDPCFPCQHGS